MHRVILLLLIVVFTLLPQRAVAHHGKEFLITSTYKTPGSGSLFALWSSQYANSPHPEGEFEFEPGLLYGLTNRWSLEVHTHHVHSAHHFQTESAALETHIRLFGPDEFQRHDSSHGERNPFSLAVLFEYKKGFGEKHDAFESRVIVGRELQSVSFVANVIGERTLEEGEGVHYRYALGVKKSLSSTIGLGLEFDGGLHRGDGVSVTPGLYGTIAHGLDFRLGPTIGFGGRADEFQLRATILYQL